MSGSIARATDAPHLTFTKRGMSSDTVPAALLTTRNRTLGVGTWRFFRFL